MSGIVLAYLLMICTSACLSGGLVISDHLREVGPCAEEANHITELRESSDQPLYGLEMPNCDDDGYYLGMQMRGSQAFCVTKNGTMIDGYSVYRWETGDNMDCQCARDQYDYMQSGLTGKLFNCDTNGNYVTTR